MMPTKINQSRYKTIYQRQENPPWDSSYVPGILATRNEAPSISIACTLTAAKLDGRFVHLLSKNERNAALLGLYCPDVFGLQEQRMLSPEPCLHPLNTLSVANPFKQIAMDGVIQIAENLNCLDLLPKILLKTKMGESFYAVYPWCGDLLWAIKQGEKFFCVNWSIKDKHEDFYLDKSKKYSLIETPSTDLLARHQIESEFYLQARIPTYHLAGDDIDKEVVRNLRRIFLHHRRSIGLSPEKINEVKRAFQTAMEIGLPASDVIENFATRKLYSVEDLKNIFYQAIWYRELLVDLFSPVLINIPLKPMEKDVLDVHGAWFKELP